MEQNELDLQALEENENPFAISEENIFISNLFLQQRKKRKTKKKMMMMTMNRKMIIITMMKKKMMTCLIRNLR